jgi:hypothetical protein
MMVEGYVKEGLAIALPIDVVGEANEEVGVLTTSRARNHGKESGRTVVDANDGGIGTVVRLYQALLALTLHQEGVFTRSFSSFRTNSPTLQVTFDGSLQGVGIVWHAVSGSWDAHQRRFSHQTVLGAAAFSLLSMEFDGDTSFQNLAEYIGLLLGCLIAVRKGWDTSAVVTVGDSATALAW